MKTKREREREREIKKKILKEICHLTTYLEAGIPSIYNKTTIHAYNSAMDRVFPSLFLLLNL